MNDEFKDTSPSQAITEEEATALLKGDEYLTDLDILQLIDAASATPARDFHSLAERHSKRGDLFPRNSSANQRLALSIIRAKVTSYRIQYRKRHEDITGQLELRIKPSTVFHVDKATRALLVDGLGLILAYMSPPSLATLAAIWAGATTYHIARELFGCYEELRDKNERAVFETVYRLQNKYVVVNYDVLRSSDFGRAYGSLSPTMQEIEEDLSGQVDRRILASVLYGLERRKILYERRGRWSIRLV